MQSESTLSPGLVRLEKYIAHIGLASRREAKDLIKQGLVFVNGSVVTETGFGIDPTHDIVTTAKNLPEKNIIAYNKPRGIETSKTDPMNRDIHDELPEWNHLPPIGRLDKDSHGLIILSNDGVLARMITSENSEIEKEYIVTVRELVTDEALLIMSRGVLLDGEMTLPCVTKKIDDHVFSIILREGRKHQIRRMADAVRLTIESLQRVRIGKLSLGNLSIGEWREITRDDVV